MKRTGDMIRNRARRTVIKRPFGDTVLLYRLFYERCGGRSFYSISVTKIDCGGKCRCVERVRDVASEREDALRIFDAVSRGLVTPMCAAEIISDLVGVYL